MEVSFALDEQVHLVLCLSGRVGEMCQVVLTALVVLSVQVVLSAQIETLLLAALAVPSLVVPVPFHAQVPFPFQVRPFLSVLLL